MENNASCEREISKIMDFICETKEGKYTLEKPDLTHITYNRVEIDTNNIFNEYSDEIVLYGISY